MKAQEAIEILKGMQSPSQDYADMVGAPAWAYGCRYVYPEPEDYAIEEAITALEEKQNRRWIPVSDRMPAPEYSKAVKERGSNAVVPVLATVRKKNEFTDNDEYSVVDRAFFGNIDKECTFFDISATKIDVVAWMPLPEPYRP